MGSSGTEAGWCGAPPTGNNNISNQGTEHFHTSFLTLPTTPLEAAGVGVIVMPRVAAEGAWRESEVKDIKGIQKLLPWPHIPLLGLLRVSGPCTCCPFGCVSGGGW